MGIVTSCQCGQRVHVVKYVIWQGAKQGWNDASGAALCCLAEAAAHVHAEHSYTSHVELVEHGQVLCMCTRTRELCLMLCESMRHISLADIAGRTLRRIPPMQLYKKMLHHDVAVLGCCTTTK